MRTRRTVVPVVLALVGVLALAGCGGDDNGGGNGGQADGGVGTGQTDGGGSTGGESSGGSRDVDPCDLLTDDDVTAATGREVTRRQDLDVVHDARTCEWTLDGINIIHLSVWQGREYYAPDVPGATAFTPVDGVADAAHLFPNIMGLCGVMYRVGETVVQINASDASDEVCVDLARRSAGKL